MINLASHNVNPATTSSSNATLNKDKKNETIITAYTDAPYTDYLSFDYLLLRGHDLINQARRYYTWGGRSERDSILFEGENVIRLSLELCLLTD